MDIAVHNNMSTLRVNCHNCSWKSTNDNTIFNQVGYKCYANVGNNKSVNYYLLSSSNNGDVARGDRDGGSVLFKSDYPPCPRCGELGTIYLEVYCKFCKEWTTFPRIYISSPYSGNKKVNHTFGCSDCDTPVTR